MSKVELKPGQKFPTPTRGFGDRVFYETLLKQNPDSEMAQEWCVNYGVLLRSEAERLYKIIMKRKGKVVQNSSSKSDVKKKKKVKKEIKEDVDDIGMNVGGDEIVGGVTM
jgi:uncharacterized protein YycO